ncbi:MAG TPA: amidohydrolase [Thermoplasmata archaeon]|nr:amidohydrolase [Thermoplasmata archaeon]
MTRAHRFTGGPIFTGARYVEALLVEDGIVRAAGAEPEVRRASPVGTEHVELHGHLVVPGLIDAHLHLPELTQYREGLDVGEARSVVALGALLRAWSSSHPTGPIVARGWTPDRMDDPRWITARDLDAAVPDRPVVVEHASGHMAILNRVALDLAGLRAETPDPAGGRIGRDRDGSPNGPVFERAQRLVHPVVRGAFPPDPGGWVRTLRSAARLGLTSVATLNTGPEEVDAFRVLAAGHDLPLRVRAYVRLAQYAEFSPARCAPVSGADRWRVIGAKAFVDGAFGPRTAWLSEPYSDAPGEQGLEVTAPGPLQEAVDWAVDAGLAPALHAIGDRAVERAARYLAPLAGRDGPAPRIEHVGLVPPELFPVLDRSRPALVVQPGFVWSDHWLGARLGAARARWAYPFRSLLERGHRLAGSSDAPYDPLDPWRGLAACVRRTDPEGRSANPAPEEALAPEEAFRLYGAHAGAVLGEVGLGTLEVGAPADLLRLSDRSLEGALRSGAAGVRETWVAGAPVPREDPARPPRG